MSWSRVPRRSITTVKRSAANTRNQWRSAPLRPVSASQRATVSSRDGNPGSRSWPALRVSTSSQNNHQPRSMRGSPSATISQSRTATTSPSRNIWLASRESPQVMVTSSGSDSGRLACSHASAARAPSCGRPCSACSAHSSDST